MRRGCDLHVHVEHGYRPFTSTYIMGAIYMAMVALLFGRRPRDDTIIFGAVGCGIAFSSKWELDKRYVTVCRKEGFRHVIIGAGTTVADEVKKRAEKAHPVDGEPCVKLITVDRILDAVPLYFQS